MIAGPDIHGYGHKDTHVCTHVQSATEVKAADLKLDGVSRV